MSLEQFYLNHPAQAELKQILAHKKFTEGRSDRSLVGLLAEDLTKAASGGMRELTKGMAQSGVVLSARDLECFNKWLPKLSNQFLSITQL